jgi:hypothetical protein
MILETAVKNYIKNYYCVGYVPSLKEIMLVDEIENPHYGTKINLTKIKGIEVNLYWSKIQDVTGIEYFYKDYNPVISRLMLEIVRDKKTKEFLKLIINDNQATKIKIEDFIDEFPILNL